MSGAMGQRKEVARRSVASLFLWPAVSLFLALLLLLMTFGLVYRPWRQGVLQLEQDRQQWSILKHELEHGRARQRDLQRLQGGMDWLQTQRVLEPEQRLGWVDVLTAAARPGIVNLRYSIAPQRDFEWQAPEEIQTGLYRLRASRMELHMDILHEGHWLALFERLEREAPGWFATRHCVAGFRAGTQTGHLPLSIECSLDWLSIVPQAPVPPSGQAHGEPTQDLLP